MNRKAIVILTILLLIIVPLTIEGLTCLENQRTIKNNQKITMPDINIPNINIPNINTDSIDENESEIETNPEKDIQMSPDKTNIELPQEENLEQEATAESEISNETKIHNEQKEPPPTIPYDKTADDKNKFADIKFIGRFKIESVGVDVACYDTYQQYVVDEDDSAVFFYGYGNLVIADHKNQGFDAIKRCEEGMIATLETEYGLQKFICTKKILGHNTGETLTDTNGQPLRCHYENALVLYTCNENWQNITIVFFVPLNELLPDNMLHDWQEWQYEWASAFDDSQKFHCESRTCTMCNMREWRVVYD